jgi:transcriptional regulator of nitric oxide reductase
LILILLNKINNLHETEPVMRIVYNSEQYYVAEYPGQQGLELVDKRSSRGTFFTGDVAEKFANAMNAAAGDEATTENIDAFLENFSALLNSPVVYH